ncbi:MAG: PD40 domain-containing protein [Mucilaginibacter polytrichastri]|nr:PD40 domain-containing protein [Mucilaginibacter polytrichastri]
MKKTFLSLVLASCFHPLFSQTQPVYFAANPTLSPDGKTIIFSYAGDLWKTDEGHPVATRLTAMQGDETNPRISPDGKWLAFSSNQFGNSDVYVMPMTGGDIRQITFSDAPDEVESWSWDSQTIYFTSSRYNNFSAYKVSVNGGTPKRLFGNYFNTIHGLVEAPNGELFFGDTWESYRFSQRKQYKGAYNPDIQSYNPATKQYKKYTDWEGKDFWTTIDSKGNVYFVSDEANGEFNLYTLKNGVKTALTKFETSIRRPFVSADGRKIVFEKDYQLFVYDVAGGQTSPVNISVFRNNVLPKQQPFNVKGNIEAFDVSPDGKKLAFISRGEVFVSDIEGKYVRKLNRSSERALELKWMADNRTLLFTQTLDGFQNLYTIAADGNGQAKAITQLKKNCRNLITNEKRTQALYLSGRDELCMIDLKSMASKLLVKDEFWGFQNAQPRFSPDENYAVFTSHRNFEQDIFVCNLKTGKVQNLTHSGISETDPFWSPDGQSIFFSSSRTTPSYPYGPRNPHIYQMALSKKDRDFRSDKFSALFKAEEKPVTDTKKKGVKKAAKKKKDEKEEDKPKPAAPIDTVNLMRRLTRISSDYGSQDGPYVIKKDDKLKVYYLSDQNEGKPALYCTTLDPFDEPKTEKAGNIETRNIDFVHANNKYYALYRGTIHTFNPDANKADDISIDFAFDRNLDGEFRQMFAETWANLDENYYDPKFHDIDWKAIRERYAKFLPYLNNRSDLRLMLNDMLGELNSSHVGFSTYGSEESTTLNYRTMETGIVFDDEKPFAVKRIVENSPADRQSVSLQAGDELISVNGVPVDQTKDRNAYFTQPGLPGEVGLVFSRGGKSFSIKVHPEATSAFRDNLYDDWIEQNRKIVGEKGRNRIAYVYMKNMGGDALENFLEDMVQDAWQKDALILDLRYNTGGNVHDPVLQFLSQKPYLQWQYRGGAKSPQPNFAPAGKPIILLVNEQTLSDGEMTTAGFKTLKLGKVIGTETYRWIIFTSGKGLVDGSFYRIPAWGCFTLDGQDIEKTGVKPDIDVKTTFTDRLSGNDPQLDRAVQEILNQLK